MDWTKREGTTRKVEPYAKLLEKEKFSFHRVISKFVLEHNIPPDLMLNLDQTPSSYVSPYYEPQVQYFQLIDVVLLFLML